MKAIIEFCAGNAHNGTDRTLKKLEQEHLDYDVVEYGCLGNCGQCYLEPYALVNGRIVAAADADELYDKIVQAVESGEDDDPFAFVDDLD